MRYLALTILMTVLLLVGGCSPLVQRAGTENRSPTLESNAFYMRDGARLPLKIWKAEKTEAVLIAVHGFNDYRNGFAFPASWWLQNGITTYAYDQRGFGETEQTGIWASEELLISDLKSVVRLVREREGEKPIYLIGESMGGAVVMSSVVEEDFPKIDGIVLSAPAVWGWQSLNPFYKMSLWIGAHLFGGAKATGKGLGIQASDNIPMLRNLGRDPLFIKKTRIDAVYGIVGIMDRAYDTPEKLTLPTLVLYGANDEVIPKPPVEDVVARLPKSADIALYKDGWHLLMRDLQAPVVWKDIAEWVKKRELPSGSKVSRLPLFPDL